MPARLLYSSRTLEDVIYRAELDALATPRSLHTLTREQPPGWTGYARRVDAALLAEVAWPAEQDPRVFVCGPTPFVESVAADARRAGLPARASEDRTVRSRREVR